VAEAINLCKIGRLKFTDGIDRDVFEDAEGRQFVEDDGDLIAGQWLPPADEPAMGQRIQKLRRAAGYSQTGLARATGIPVGTIKNWEQGIRTPRIDSAAKVCKALGVSVEALLVENDADKAPPATAAKARKRGK
jgi:DNA-binding XRE family transcriptional regulator